MKTYNRLLTRDNFWESGIPWLNCGSFALGVDEWFTPYEDRMGVGENKLFYNIEDEISYRLAEGLSLEETYEALLDEDSHEILNKCPWCRLVSTVEAKKHTTNIVAYRLAIVVDDDGEVLDYDFHFRLLKDGVWCEKCGGRPTRECREQDWNIFEKPWDTNSNIIYDSPIVYFLIED